METTEQCLASFLYKKVIFFICWRQKGESNLQPVLYILLPNGGLLCCFGYFFQKKNFWERGKVLAVV